MRYLAWGIVGLTVACGGGNGTGTGGVGGGVPHCVPGDSKSCVGPGACAGYQVCAADGTYGTCMCGSGGMGGVGGGGGRGGVGGLGGLGGSTGGTAGGGRGGTSDAGMPDASPTCPTDPAVAAVVFGPQLDRLATAVCEWEQRCYGAADADYAACVDSWRQAWATSWADECGRNHCPDGIVESRFQAICLDLPEHLIPCTAMHGIVTYIHTSCELSTICQPEPDAGGQ
jgi:hypothetical protein